MYPSGWLVLTCTYFYGKYCNLKYSVHLSSESCYSKLTNLRGRGNTRRRSQLARSEGGLGISRQRERFRGVRIPLGILKSLMLSTRCDTVDTLLRRNGPNNTAGFSHWSSEPNKAHPETQEEQCRWVGTGSWGWIDTHLLPPGWRGRV